MGLYVDPTDIQYIFGLEGRQARVTCLGRRLQDRGVKLIFARGHISLVVAFKGPNVILGLYKCNYSLTRGKELGAAARQKQGAWPDKTRWRAGFGLWVLCLPPLLQENDAGCIAQFVFFSSVQYTSEIPPRHFFFMALKFKNNVIFL